MRRMLMVVAGGLVLSGVILWWTGSGNERSRSAAAATIATGTDPKDKETPFVAGKLALGAPPAGNSLAFFDPIVVAPCQIAPVQEQEVSSQIDGLLQDIRVDLGHKIVKGTLLGRLDDRQYRTQLELLEIKAVSQAGELIAKAQYDDAKNKLEMWKKLIDRNATSILEYQTNIHLSERYAQEIQKAREDRAVNQKELERVKVLIGYHEVRSGLDGEVTKIYKRPGESVKQAEPLFRLADYQHLHIEGLCKVQQADLLRVGMVALVQPEVRGEQMTQLTGHTAAVTSIAVAPDGRLLASASEDRTVLLWNWPQGTRVGLLPHPGEVHAIALARLPEALNKRGSWLLSGCADGHGRLWLLPESGTVASPTILAGSHDGPIRAVAFSPDGLRCATGSDDRRIGVWETTTGKHLYWLQQTEDAPAHNGAITSLHFTRDGQLVSAGRDNTIKIWKLGNERGTLVASQPGRTGDVTQLGISPDGRSVLFDHGDELRIIDRGDLACLGIVRSARHDRFRGLALFSPTGRWIAAAAGNGRLQLWRVPASPEQVAFFRQAHAHGFHRATLLDLFPSTIGLPLSGASLSPAVPRLWDLHAQEVRQYLAPGTGVSQCGAFAPDETVFFTGGTDKVVRVWALPPRARASQHLEARITFIGSQVEGGTDMVKIRADMHNPADPALRLRPGTYASLLVYPETR